MKSNKIDNKSNFFIYSGLIIRNIWQYRQLVHKSDKIRGITPKLGRFVWQISVFIQFQI